MAITYSLAPNPIWAFLDVYGKPLGGGSMTLRSSLNPEVEKFVYQDEAGEFPYPNPVIFDANGTRGPFYWEFDSDTPDDLYYLEVKDSAGNLAFPPIDNFIPPGGSGGSIVNTALTIDNLITNNRFWRNIGQTENPISNLITVIAPSNNSGLTKTASGAWPDICFSKNNTNAADQIKFLSLTLGDNPFTDDVQPPYYLNYSCTNNPLSEIYKYIQFPISAQVQNLSQQATVATLWARSNAGANTLTLQWLQFFGDGAGASPTAVSTIMTITLTNAWQKFNIPSVIPNVAGKVLGGCGNDGLFLLMQYPLGIACNIDVAIPSIFLGNLAPTQDYQSYDSIDSIISHARTGQVKIGFDCEFGWVPANDGTIGNASSGATTRANIDTFPLYNLIWNGVSDMYAPVIGGRGSSAILDFTADKQLTLTAVMGRALCGAGTGSGLSARQTGQNFGVENQAISVPNLPAHSHPAVNSGTFVCEQGETAFTLSYGTSVDYQVNPVFFTGNTGNGVPMNIVPPSIFLNIYFKL